MVLLFLDKTFNSRTTSVPLNIPDQHKYSTKCITTLTRQCNLAFRNLHCMVFTPPPVDLSVHSSPARVLCRIHSETVRTANQHIIQSTCISFGHNNLTCSCSGALNVRSIFNTMFPESTFSLLIGLSTSDADAFPNESSDRLLLYFDDSMSVRSGPSTRVPPG